MRVRLKLLLNQKLEQEQGLSLEEAEEEEKHHERRRRREPPVAPHVSFQQLFHQNQLLYGRLDLESPNKRSYLHSSSSYSSLETTSEHARLLEKMEDSNHHHRTSSRLGLKSNSIHGGEIVEVQGGHIIRSTGRKDRHSKVCTAKGPRDRRVRLAAHTAIQFYDVQDRLGYDRPSKAVDWLIKKAQAAIDELAQLPAWHPTAINDEAQKKLEEGHNENASNCNGDNPNFLPPSLGSDAIADTMKSFFPTGAAAEGSSSAVQFQNNHGHNQDLKLSLQSFQDPMLLQQNPTEHSISHSQAQVLLNGTPLGFDGTLGWLEHHHQQAAELSRFQRLESWTACGDTVAGSGGAAGYLFNSPPASQPLLQQLLGGHNQFISQRGPLQSSNTPSIRAWMDPSAISDHHPQAMPIYPSSMSGLGFSGFLVPARIQGDEEEHDGYSDKPSSASSDSRH
ncbi:hypothetical protein BUALT_Bualt18G0044600 [Buddleja alternifolia]|uniref:TCP domain-containing protein n=1 Tax=Buddleja alternifolia TaxID=168488 RepID=A0AAV6W3U1_9LAMI|nr:hypothetical protein BUALT_Bualt18G0044600 [Buddleja alternifolia]